MSRTTLLISPSSLIEFAVETLEGWFWSYNNGYWETFRCTASSSVKSLWLMMMLCIETSLTVIVRSKSSFQCLYWEITVCVCTMTLTMSCNNLSLSTLVLILFFLLSMSFISWISMRGLLHWWHREWFFGDIACFPDRRRFFFACPLCILQTSTRKLVIAQHRTKGYCQLDRN